MTSDSEHDFYTPGTPEEHLSPDAEAIRKTPNFDVLGVMALRSQASRTAALRNADVDLPAQFAKHDPGQYDGTLEENPNQLVQDLQTGDSPQ